MCPICRQRTDWGEQFGTRTEFDILLQSITNQAPGTQNLVIENVAIINTSSVSDEMRLILEALLKRKSLRSIRNGEMASPTQIFRYRPGSDRLIVNVGPFSEDNLPIRLPSKFVKFDLLMQKFRLHSLMSQNINTTTICLRVNDMHGNIDYALLQEVLVRYKRLIRDIDLYNIKGRILIPASVRRMRVESCDVGHICLQELLQPTELVRRSLRHLCLANITWAIRNATFFEELKLYEEITALVILEVIGDARMTRELIEIVNKCNVSTLEILSCEFRDERNKSCVHKVLDACLAQNLSVVIVDETELGRVYQPSHTWPERWTIDTDCEEDNVYNAF